MRRRLLPTSSRTLTRRRLLLPTRRRLLLLPTRRMLPKRGRIRRILLVPSCRLTKKRLVGRWDGSSRSRLLILPETIPKSVHETIGSGIGRRLLLRSETIPKRSRLMLLLEWLGLILLLLSKCWLLLIEPICIGSSMRRLLILLLKMLLLPLISRRIESSLLLPGLRRIPNPFEY